MINNGAVHFIATIIHRVMSSVSKAEVEALFVHSKEGIIIINSLKELGHPQPAPTLQTDDFISYIIVNGSMVQNHSKSIEMRFFSCRIKKFKDSTTYIGIQGTKL